jgi:hypothetical protein
LAARINEEIRAGLQHAKNVGDLLVEAKKQCPHGQWLPWLKKNVNLSERTAQAYMRVAKHWERLEGKSATVADLTYRSALETLADKPAAKPADEPDDRTPFQTGKCYRILGHSHLGMAYLEIDPHPDHPGFWTMTFYHLVGGGFADYIGRGIRLDSARLLRQLFECVLRFCARG